MVCVNANQTVSSTAVNLASIAVSSNYFVHAEHCGMSSKRAVLVLFKAAFQKPCNHLDGFHFLQVPAKDQAVVPVIATCHLPLYATKPYTTQSLVGLLGSLLNGLLASLGSICFGPFQRHHAFRVRTKKPTHLRGPCATSTSQNGHLCFVGGAYF